MEATLERKLIGLTDRMRQTVQSQSEKHVKIFSYSKKTTLEESENNYMSKNNYDLNFSRDNKIETSHDKTFITKNSIEDHFSVKSLFKNNI